MLPRISVIMAVYNTKKYLKKATESILSQTFNEFEFIIVDDFSTDGSYELLQEYEKKALIKNTNSSKSSLFFISLKSIEQGEIALSTAGFETKEVR